MAVPTIKLQIQEGVSLHGCSNHSVTNTGGSFTPWLFQPFIYKYKREFHSMAVPTIQLQIQEGSWALDCSPESLSQGGYKQQNINPFSPTPKSILGITPKPTKSLSASKIYLSAQF